MSDQERIHQLEREGKITPEEAERLLAALGELSEAEEEMAALDARLEPEAAPSAAPAPSPAAGAEAEAAEARHDVLPEAPSAPEGLRWVRVSVLAGDIDIRVDPELREPQVESAHGNVSVSREGDGFLIAAAKREAAERAPRREGVDGFLDGISDFVGGLLGRIGGDLDIRVPQGFGVVIDSKSGDVDIEGVPFVKAKLLAGDLDLRNVGGVDLSMSAGDVDATLLLTRGEHRIKVSAGDVDVKLLPGSSVTVSGSVSMGDVEAGSPLQAGRTGMGGRLSGQLGAGAAKLELSLSAGDLEVRGG